MINTQLINLPFSNWNIWMFTQTSWCVFTWLCECHLKLESDKGSSFFYLGYFSSSKNLNHITKNASILHLKLGNYYKPNLPALQNTPPITTADLLQVVNFWHGEIQLTYSKWSIFDLEKFWHLVWTHLMSCKFSIHFPNLRCIYFVHFSNLRCIYKSSFARLHLLSLSRRTSVTCVVGPSVNTLRVQLIFLSKPNFCNLFEFPATKSTPKSISSTL